MTFLEQYSTAGVYGFMISAQLISKLEHAGILVFTFIVFACFASSLTSIAIATHNDSVIENQQQLRRKANNDSGPSDYSGTSIRFSGYTPRPAPFHLLTFFIFLSLVKPKRFIATAVLTVVYGGVLVLALYFRQRELDMGEGTLSQEALPTRMFFYLNNWDLVGFTFVVIMLVWLLSMFLRFRRHRETYQ